MQIPDYVTIWPDDQDHVDINKSTRFTWRPASRELSFEPKTSPELFSELAQTGAIDGLRSIRISEWAKGMTRFPDLPESVTSTLTSITVNSAKFDGWEELYHLPQLELLEVGEKVSALPDGISSLARLTRLRVEGKRLAVLPADLSRLPRLRHLELVNCPITELPETLGELPLAALRLSWTKKLKALPETLGLCHTLRVVETDGVPLKSLPEGMWTLPHLEELLLRSSKISRLGARITLPSLVRLDLQGKYKKWPTEVALPALEDAVLSEKFTDLPELTSPRLKRLWVNAPLTRISKRYASIPSTPGKGLRLTCTKATYEALDEDTRAAYAGRLVGSW